MSDRLTAAAAHPAAGTDLTILGLSVEAFAASASAVLALVSFIVAAIALRASIRSEAELRLVRREDLTDKRIGEFESAEMVAMRHWIQTRLAAHAENNKCPFGGGLTQLNVGPAISMPSETGAPPLMAGQICIRVLRFYGRVASQITERRLESDRVVDSMGDDIVDTWRAMGPYLKHKTIGDYYQWFRRRYSMASLALVLMENETRADRIKALEKRPSIWRLPGRS